jgi:hypothetical protein
MVKEDSVNTKSRKMHGPESRSRLRRLEAISICNEISSDRDKYQRRLSKFFEFAGVKGELAKEWIGQEAIVTLKEKESRAKGKK